MSDQPNWVSWFEIPVQDLDRATKFYESIFNCSMEHLDLGPGHKMSVFPHAEVGGALVQHSYYEPGHQGSLLYLNGGHDLNDVLQKVEPAGGTVLFPKRQISEEHGYMAVFLDTEGNRLALHSYH